MIIAIVLLKLDYFSPSVDFPSSPSAMMKYRDDDEEEERNRMSRSNQPHNNGSGVVSLQSCRCRFSNLMLYGTA